MTQQPYYPQYPQAPAPPQPQQFAQPYPQQQYPQPVQQGYPQPMPQPAQQPLAQGTLDDFYNQPSSGGGPSLKFERPGTRYVGIVTRAIGPGDVQQQTNTQGVPLTFKDGRPKWVMKVPLQMQPSQQYPDGLAQWYVKGQARDELARAMAEAGAPAGAPEANAILDITFTGTRPAGTGMNPAKLFAVRYQRPEGAQPVQQQQPAQQVADAPSPAPAPQQPTQPPVQQPAPQIADVAQQVYQQPQVQQPVQYPPQGQVQPQAAQPQPPSDLSPEQQQLLAKLTGGQG